MRRLLETFLLVTLDLEWPAAFCSTAHPRVMLRGFLDRLVRGHRTTLDPLGKILSADQRHRREPNAADLVQPVHRRDLRVAQGGEQPGLALESTQPLTLRGEGLGKKVDRDAPFEPRVERLPHHSPPALADLPDQAAVEQPLSGRDGQAPARQRGYEPKA